MKMADFAERVVAAKKMNQTTFGMVANYHADG